MPPSTSAAAPSPRKERSDAELTEKISAMCTESKGTYGSPRVHHELVKRGVACGRRRVRRLMRRGRAGGPLQEALAQDHGPRPRGRGGQGPHPAPLRTLRRARPPLRRRHHLHRHLGGLGLPGDRHRPGLPPGRRLGARRPHAHRARRRRARDGVRPPPAAKGAIFHSDRGCQYTSLDYGELARANGVVLSVGRMGECWDNAVAESFFATIKRELIDTRAWPTRAGLRRAVFDYIEGWYNTRRLHSTLGYRSPAEYEALIHHNADRQAA